MKIWEVLAAAAAAAWMLEQPWIRKILEDEKKYRRLCTAMLQCAHKECADYPRCQTITKPNES